MNSNADFVIEDGLLKKYTGKAKVVVVPDEVTSIGCASFAGRDDIISVTLPESVIYIEDYAFFECSSLTLINIPYGVKSIGKKAFLGCGRLKSITIPDTVTTIGQEAFRLCRQLADENGFVVIRGVLFGYYGMADCVTIPETVTAIDDCAFFGRRGIEKLIIQHNRVKSIGKAAFEGCSSLKTIQLPENEVLFENSVIEILWEHFYKTKYKLVMMYALLKQYPEFVINNKVINKKIKANKKKLFARILAEDNVKILELLFSLYKKIQLDDLNEFINAASSSTSMLAFLMKYKAENYPLQKLEKYENDNADKELGIKERTLSDWKKIYNFKIEGENVTITGYKGKDTDISVPEKIGKYKVDAIDIGAFSPVQPGVRKETQTLRENIHTVIVPDSIKTLKNGVFCGCINLTAVTLPKGIEEISWAMFGNCSRLTSVIIPDSVTKIAGVAFVNCSSLTSITVPEKVMSIGERAFMNCKVLNPVELKGRILSIGERVFTGCRALADEKGFVIINNVLYGYYGTDKNITIPAKTQKIDGDAFAYCDEIETVVIPESVKELGKNIFTGCHSMKAIRIPKHISEITGGTFNRCTNLEKVVIENSLTQIRAHAFIGCPNLSIYARAGSCAEKYAKENGIPFVKI